MDTSTLKFSFILADLTKEVIYLYLGTDMPNAINAFNDTIKFISTHQETYLKRFNFAACELWLCTEICHFLNFNENTGISSKGEEFAYNEDRKRDISLYTGNRTPLLTDHIEAKVVYPTNRLTTKDNWLYSLKNKIEKSITNATHDVQYHGWVFGVWTSDDKYIKKHGDPATFFERDHNVIRERLKENYTSPSDFKYIDIMNGTFLWRGKEKRIVVKGFQFPNK